MALASLLTLIDDIAAVLDDVALMAKVAAKKTAGVVGDDLALNANQVAGAAAERELPIVWAVAKGSLLNKAVLIPIALLLAAFAPSWITPLLMVGGAYLCFEGAEKLLHRFSRHEDGEPQTVSDSIRSEKDKINGAIRTDFILSAEIIILALGEISGMAGTGLWGKAVALALVGIAITLFVYGIVALIVKADDFGFWLIRKGRFAAFCGRALIRFVPWFMRALGLAGTAAMFLVGGGIFTHYIPLLHSLPWQHGLAGAALSLGTGVAVGLVVCAAVFSARRLFVRR